MAYKVVQHQAQQAISISTRNSILIGYLCDIEILVYAFTGQEREERRSCTQ